MWRRLLEFPEQLHYTESDEWVRIEGDEAVVGITDYAQDQLGDTVYVELPEPGRALAQGEAFGVVESIKAVSDLYAPFAGVVLATNEVLRESPELINHAPYEEGWIVRLRMSDPAAREGLLSAEAYRALRGKAT